MLFVTTCCIYKSTSYIYLFNNCKEKCTFSTQPRVLRDQISQEILVEIVIFLCLSKIYFSGFTWSKLHFKSQDETVPIRSWIFHILAILLRTSQVNNVWVYSLLTKITIELYCDLWKLFCSKWTEIIVEIQLIWFWLANVLCLLSDHRKEEIIRSMNLINGFGARSYSIRGIHLPIVLLTKLSMMYKLKESTLYSKCGENNTIYFLFTQYVAP